MRKLNKNCKIEIFKYLSKGDITSYLCALYQGTPKESRGEIIEMFLFLFDNILDVETIEKDKKLESIHIIKPKRNLCIITTQTLENLIGTMTLTILRI